MYKEIRTHEMTVSVNDGNCAMQPARSAESVLMVLHIRLRLTLYLKVRVSASLTNGKCTCLSAVTAAFMLQVLQGARHHRNACHCYTHAIR
jgi:hypothetical protein